MMKTNFTKTNIQEINKFNSINDMKHVPMNFVYSDSKMFILFDREKETFDVNHLHKNVDIDKVMKLCESYEKERKEVDMNKVKFIVKLKINKDEDFSLTSCDDEKIHETFDIYSLDEMFHEEILSLKKNTMSLKYLYFLVIYQKIFHTSLSRQ